MMLDPVLQHTLLGAFALLFAFAALEKWQAKALFAAQLGAYQLLPAALVTPASFLVMALEVITATLLLTTGNHYGCLLGISLLLAYGGAITINLVRGRSHIDCGCLGSEGEGISYHLVVRNLVLAGLLAIPLLPTADRAYLLLDYFSVIAGVIALSAAYLTINTLIRNSIQSRLWWQQ